MVPGRTRSVPHDRRAAAEPAATPVSLPAIAIRLAQGDYDVAITARFSRSAVICACIERRIDSGGVRLLIS